MKLSDYELWKEYTKSIKRIDRNKICHKSNNITANNTAIKSQSQPIQFIKKQELNLSSRKNLSLVPMNRKERRQFREEATVDLHGFTRNAISEVLQNFCLKCIYANIKNITIITGKGDGILKQETLSWLNSSSSIIVGFFPIYDSKKETGSYAIRLRKLKK